MVEMTVEAFHAALAMHQGTAAALTEAVQQLAEVRDQLFPTAGRGDPDTTRPAGG